MKRAVFGLLAFVLLGGQAAPPDDPEATTVEEFVVRGRLPGPAWWKVSDGDSTVYILGIPEALPKGQAWDQSVLKKRLKGANGLITPPVIRAGANPLAMPALMARYDKAGKSGSDLASTLPAGQWARLERAAQATGRKPDRYRPLKPWFAGMRLSGDHRRRAGLVYDEPLRTVTRAARQAKVKATPASQEDTKVARVLDQLEAMPADAGRPCLQGAIEEVEIGAGAVRRAGQAWASGDVSGMLAAPRISARCWAAIPGTARMARSNHGDQADAIAAALRRPGHTVAVLYVRSLVAQGGVLERLRARGFTVEAPE